MMWVARGEAAVIQCDWCFAWQAATSAKQSCNFVRVDVCDVQGRTMHRKKIIIVLVRKSRKGDDNFFRDKRDRRIDKLSNSENRKD